jgi:hypothetical protein
LKGMEAEEKTLGLHEISHDEIVSTQKRFEANEKEIEKLKRKLFSFEGTITARRMQTARKSQNLCEDINELQSQVRALEAQVMKLETTIMSNQGLKQRPPHFIEPMTLTEPHPKPMPDGTMGSMSSTQPKAGPVAPKGPPPATSPRQQQQQKQLKESPVTKAKGEASPPKTKVVKPAPSPKATSEPKSTAKPTPVAPTQRNEDSSPRSTGASVAPASESEPTEQGRLNDIDDDRTPTPRSPTPIRSPTPPAEPEKSPTPPAAEREKSPTPPAAEREKSPTPPAAEEPNKSPTPPADDVKKSPTPPPNARPESTPARYTPPAENDDAAYGDDDFEESPTKASTDKPEEKKPEESNPAFLTD